MNTFRFSDTPQRRHRVHRVHGERGSDQFVVDGDRVTVQALGEGRFRATLDGQPQPQPQQFHAVPDGDAVLVQWRGRGWRIERVDATRSNAAAGGSEAGASHAPMPGVVVSTLATVGQRVSEGDALLVIESMKLQTTLTAACNGTLQALPVAVGQTFQRGAVLAQVKAEEVVVS